MTDNMADLCKKVKDRLSYPLYAITYGQKSVLSVIWGISTECLTNYIGTKHRHICFHVFVTLPSLTNYIWTKC